MGKDWEKNRIKKKWERDSLKIALISPNTYFSSTGLTMQVLYHIWNKIPNVICERFYYPNPDISDYVISSDEFSINKYKNYRENSSIYKKKKRNHSAINRSRRKIKSKIFSKIRSLESGNLLQNFDIIAISIQYELDLPKIWNLLQENGIPPFRSERHILSYLEKQYKPRDHEKRNINYEYITQTKIESTAINSSYNRGEANQDFPIIIVGGPVIRSNPLPLSPLFDVAFIGEIEPVNDSFIDAWFKSFRPQHYSQLNNQKILSDFSENSNYFKRILSEIESKSGDKEYDEFLINLSQIEGFWVPSIDRNLIQNIKDSNIKDSNIKDSNIKDPNIKDPNIKDPNIKDSNIKHSIIKRVHVKDLDSISHPINQVYPDPSICSTKFIEKLPFGNSFFVEVNRGCPHACHFCMTGYQLKPFRNRSLSELKRIIITGLKQTNLTRVVLIGSSVSDHPQFKELCEFLVKNNIPFSIPSIRAETITPGLAKLFYKAGIKTITIAPETGTDRLRKCIGKKITNNELFNAAKILMNAGINQLKLYFLFGFPGEKDEDLIAIPNLAKKIASLGYGKWGIRLSVNPVVPKAHTPLEQDISLYLDYDMFELKRRWALISEPLKGDKQIKLEKLDLSEAYLQTIFALGDESAYYWIEKFANIGNTSSKWYKSLKRDSKLQLIKSYFANLINTNMESLPWSFINQGIPLSFKIKQRELGKRFCNEKIQ